MNPTETLIGKKARKAVHQGVNLIYNVVRGTLGPEPKKILLFRTFNRGARIVDDGHWAADAQEPKNPFIRQSAAAFKEACKRTNELVGDQTATTAVIGGVLFNDAYDLLDGEKSDYTATQSKKGSSTLRRSLIATANTVKAAIRKSAVKIKTIEDLEHIAVVSVGDKEVGNIIAKVAWDVGEDGFIDVIEGYKTEIETEVIRGMRFPGKPAAKAFLTNPGRYEMVGLDCPVFITNYALDNEQEVAKLFQKFNQTTKKIVVVAPLFSDTVLIGLVNAVKAGFFIYPIKAPSLRTEQFEDLAIYCGANFIDKQRGKSLATAGQHDLGFIEKVIVKDTEGREDAVATGGAGTKPQFNKDGEQETIATAVALRIKTLKEQLEEQREPQFKKLMERRIASMASAVGVIKVGSPAQATTLDLKLKIEDSVYACKAALRSGYVKGGGLCLKDIAETLPKDDILVNALIAPWQEIQNSVDGGIQIGDDIIDSADGIFYAVHHAVEVVANLMTVDKITVEAPQTDVGDATMALARATAETAIAYKRHFGLIQESQEEAERDRLNGLTLDEKVSLDQG